MIRRRIFCLLSVFFVSSVATSTGAADKEVPAWARHQLPPSILPYVGRSGLPAPWPQRKDPIGLGTAGIDFWQANNFIAHRPETAKFLYEQYTPLKLTYRKGTLPAYEKLIEKHTAGLATDRDKALALLKAMPDICRHPSIPPLSPDIPADRALDDEPLLASRAGWCNEQARIYVRLCQVAGIPARMIFLFYADYPSGHVVSEFYADGAWHMADSSWLIIFPDADGHLMSAAELHTAPGKLLAISLYKARIETLLNLPDPQLDHHTPGQARKLLRNSLAHPQPLTSFGILNYPLPE